MNKDEHKPVISAQSPFSRTYLHGTKADLKIGDLIEAGIAALTLSSQALA